MDRRFFELAKLEAVVNKYKKPHLLTKFLPCEETGIDKLIHKHCFSIFVRNQNKGVQYFCTYARYFLLRTNLFWNYNLQKFVRILKKHL